MKCWVGGVCCNGLVFYLDREEKFEVFLFCKNWNKF